MNTLNSIVLFILASIVLTACSGSDGNDGSDGAQSLVATSGIGAGTTCPSGGTRIDSGVDANGNGTLDSSEISSTEVICNGDGVIGWLDDEPLEQLDSPARNADVAVNEAGQAVAVWSQDDDGDSNSNIRVVRYTPGQGWEAVRTIASGSHATSPTVGLDDEGNAIVLWRQDGNDKDNTDDTRASRYDVSSDSWQPPTTLDALGGFVGGPTLAMNAGGDAIAAWRQDDGSGQDSIMANHFSPDSGWNPAPRTLESLSTRAASIDLAINSQGDAVAAWDQADSSEADDNADIRVNRYSAAANAWGSGATTIDVPVDGARAANPSVAMNNEGEIVAVWTQDNGTWSNVRANEFDPASGSWDFPDTPIETVDADALAADVALNDKGQGVAVWAQDDDALPDRDIRGNRYTSLHGWGNRATTIEAIDGELRTPFVNILATRPKVGLDESGHALAAWGMDTGASEDIWANEAQGGVAWGIAQLIENRDQGRAEKVALAVAPDGDAVAVWQQEDGSTQDIRAARFRKD